MRKSLNLVVVVSACAAAHISYGAESASIDVAWNAGVQALPEDCRVISENAKQAFLSGKFAFLQEVEVNYVSARDGSKIQFAIPINTYVVMYESPGVDNRFFSVFVDCNNNRAVLSARGGLSDALHWYGPVDIPVRLIDK